MAPYVGHKKPELHSLGAALTVLILSMMLAACSQQAETAAPEARPVRTITVEKREAGVPVTLTGRIEAEDEVSLSFRIAGRILQSDLKAGDRVEADQLIARLESQNERNTLRGCDREFGGRPGAVDASAKPLRATGNAARAGLDDARELRPGQKGAHDRAIASRGRRGAIEDRPRSRQLHRDQRGFSRRGHGVGPGAGEVVQAGQMIIRLARKDGRDAVFDAPAQLIRSAPTNPRIVVALTNDPKVTAQGRVRTVAPQADPVTRTFEVKVGLIDPPPAMFLGATVNVRVETESVPIIEIPATALTRFNQQPAVWVVDPAARTVAITKRRRPAV